MLNMALQLSVQDMFSSSWFSSALMNKVWTEAMRSSVNGLIRNTGRADLLGAALGGSLRGDAAMLRQASSNVSEARTMMSMAADAAGSIASLLKEAQTLADDFLTATQGMTPGPLSPYDALYERYQPLYDAISKNIDSIIQNTTYNGIPLLDGSAWKNGDPRLAVTRDAGDKPVAASVHIQAGNSGFPLAFSDMGADFAGLISKIGLYNNPDILTGLSSLQKSAQNLADMYAGRAGSLHGQAASLQSQAKILEETAAQRARTPAPVSTESLLLNLILRDSGGLFSGKG
jgi:flagellin